MHMSSWTISRSGLQCTCRTDPRIPEKAQRAVYYIYIYIYTVCNQGWDIEKYYIGVFGISLYFNLSFAVSVYNVYVVCYFDFDICLI